MSGNCRHRRTGRPHGTLRGQHASARDCRRQKEAAGGTVANRESPVPPGLAGGRVPLPSQEAAASSGTSIVIGEVVTLRV